MIGIVLVSHSSVLAQGAAELVDQIAAGARVVPAGGTDDGRLGTSTALAASGGSDLTTVAKAAEEARNVRKL